MQRRYVTVDVFTAEPFGGNPLAVVLDAQGLCASQMQSIATEFNYSETTFVLPPRDAAHTARVRIFTPRVEIPFAGHPTVGTAVVLARELEAGGAALESLLLEEGVGTIPVRLMREGATVVGAEFRAPPTLTTGSPVAVDDAAACLSLSPEDILQEEPPRVLSVGLPFLVVAVASRDALRRAKARLTAHERVLPPSARTPCSPMPGEALRRNCTPACSRRWTVSWRIRPPGAQWPRPWPFSQRNDPIPRQRRCGASSKAST